MGLIIVGVDPGTTAAWAAIDDKGRFLEARSAKQVGQSSLVSQIVLAGKPLLVASDRSKMPGFVSSVARMLGARSFSPSEDLLVAQKRELLEDFSTRKLNIHEQDALAAALFAYKKIKPSLVRIEMLAVRRNSLQLLEQLKLLLIKNPNLDFESGLRQLTYNREHKPPRKPRIALGNVNAAQTAHSEQEFLLAKDIEQLKRRIEDKERLIKKLVRKKKRQEILEIKDREIAFLRASIREKDQRMQMLQETVSCLEEFIARSSGHVLVKKLQNLTSSELEKKRFLKIGEADVLLVADPLVKSSAVVERLSKNTILVTKPGREMPTNHLLLSQDMIVCETEHFAAISAAELEKVRAAGNLLRRIVMDYKKERLVDKEDSFVYDDVN